MSSLSKYQVDGYTPTIGIECHVQFNTVSKLFTAIGNDAKDAAANTLIGPLCVGLPGTLPVLNEQAVHKAILAGLAINAEIAEITRFDRKHYFYPDLPLGYQISQFDQPIVGEGWLNIPTDDGPLRINIERAHLEADAGKLSHPDGADYSLVDLNRAGTPLLEIVSMPDMHSAIEAKAYCRELYLAMLYAGVSDCDLFHGNIRFDVNVSVSKDSSKLGTRTETKNLNSFKNVERAVEFEISRQIEELEAGNTIAQETRGWDDAKGQTFSQRSKEDAHDYRYMPDPDIPPLSISRQQVNDIAKLAPHTPAHLRTILSKIDLKGSGLETLIDNPLAARMMARIVDEHDAATAKTIANWCTGEILRMVGEQEVDWTDVEAAETGLTKLAAMVDGNQLSSTNAKEILKPVIKNNADPLKLAEEADLLQMSDEADLVILVQKVMSDNPKAVEDAKADPKAAGFLVGQIMKASRGKANPKVVNQLIQKELS